MNLAGDDKGAAPPSHVPRGGWLAMTVILAAMALLAIYSNVQKARRNKIEQVTIRPAASASPAVSPSQL